MNEDKKWMLMTYYCPTHGDYGRIEPLEISIKDLSKNIFKEERPKNKLNGSD